MDNGCPLAVMGSLGCCNKDPQTDGGRGGGLLVNTIHISPTALEPGSPRSDVSKVGFQ